MKSKPPAILKPAPKPSSQGWMQVIDAGINYSNLDPLASEAKLVHLIDSCHAERRKDITRAINAAYSRSAEPLSAHSRGNRGVGADGVRPGISVLFHTFFTPGMAFSVSMGTPLAASMETP